ncbi:hypothetical protein ABPG75_011123 [Micractinium tetrahymenae]
MRLNQFELRLVSTAGGAGGSGSPALPEVTFNGKAYAVASSGSSFEVQVSLLNHAPKLPAGVFYNASLYVDGLCVGFSKNLLAPGAIHFEGFLQEGDAQGCAMQAFVFAKPRETETEQAHNLNFQEGTIRVDMYEARHTGIETTTGRYTGPAQANNSIAKLPEGKKFFMAPSLTTGKGEVKMCPGFSTQAIQCLGGPVAVLELRYETAATLLLRGVLKDSDPTHRAILQQFSDTADKEDPGHEPEQDENAAGPANAGPGRASGRGARKRQRQLEDEVVDLTNAPAEGDEVLAAKAQDKLLECDLTGEEQPRWLAVKKEVHRV